VNPSQRSSPVAGSRLLPSTLGCMGQREKSRSVATVSRRSPYTPATLNDQLSPTRPQTASTLYPAPPSAGPSYCTLTTLPSTLSLVIRFTTPATASAP